MAQIRTTNSQCLHCGGQYPSEVAVEQRRDYRKYRCAKCGSRIAEAVVATGGDTADTPINPPMYKIADHGLRADVDWGTWEVWWTDLHVIVVMHGRVVNDAPDNALQFISHLEDRT
jgi:DNA-directed RNA polymerase subunit RPC12/RpoP